MTRPRVILASASPRRRELLRLIGVDHEVRPADIDESYLPGERPDAHAERLARGKAEAIASVAGADAVTIGSDTIVVVDGDVLGKPRDREHAGQMLRRLSGRSHVVMTGVAVSWCGKTLSGVEQVDVTFRALSDDELVLRRDAPIEPAVNAHRVFELHLALESRSPVEEPIQFAALALHLRLPVKSS